MQSADRELASRVSICDDEIDHLIRRRADLLPCLHPDAQDPVRVDVAQVAEALIEHYPAEEGVIGPVEMMPEPQQRPVEDGEISREVKQPDAV